MTVRYLLALKESVCTFYEVMLKKLIRDEQSRREKQQSIIQNYLDTIRYHHLITINLKRPVAVRPF